MKVLIYDIETLLRMFLISIYVPEEDKIYDFIVDDKRNQLDGFLKFIELHPDYYWVGYNNLRFDSQVIEFILRNHENWIEKTAAEICEIIYQIAQDVIDDSNYEVLPRYNETSLTLLQIDLFKIWHYDNKNRGVSLKRLEYEMDMENIEEMPIHHSQDTLTDEEKDLTVVYCHNDIAATYQFYLITIGETENPLYKDDNKIELRQHIEEEYGIKCLNYSNSKIGDEIIKKFYCEEKGIPYSSLPSKGTFRKEIPLRYCIPDYIEFKTQELKSILRKVKKTILKQNQDFILSFNFKGQVYTFAKGGLHNVIKGVIYESDDDHYLIDVDVSGYYPAIIINNKYYPAHLGKSFLVGYSKVYYRRIELKPLAKKDKKIKGIVAGLKEAGNCPYGKSSEITSWLYDKKMTLSTCLTGELTLLMLIEDCELNNIKCIMANTDGATFIVHKNDVDKFNRIKEEWKQKTTKVLTYSLEEVKFKKMVFSSVNDYIGIKEDGEIKAKGDFMKNFELHKNKSARIVPIALENYYVNDVPIERTIVTHTNPYDFSIRQKSSRNFHYEGIDLKTGEKTIYDKLIRYFVTNTGEKLYKIKNPECTTNAPHMAQVEAGEWLCTVRNHLPTDTSVSSLDIDFNYYIQRTERIVRKIKTGGKKQVIKTIPNQLSLF